MPLHSLAEKNPAQARQPSLHRDAQPAGPRSRPITHGGALARLDPRDVSLLTALAAMQIEYGQPHEAIAYLVQLRRQRPNDPQILRLLAVAFMKMEAWNEANIILDELEDAEGQARSGSDLLRALIRFRLSDLAGARAFFVRFLRKRNERNSA